MYTPNNDLFKTLFSLHEHASCSRIAYFGAGDFIKSYIEEMAEKLSIELYDLSDMKVRQWGFGGEYFESIIINDDSFLDDVKKIRMIKKALLKNRNLILLSLHEDEYSLREKLEPFGFSDFCKIVEDNININLTKKWFTFEQ